MTKNRSCSFIVSTKRLLIIIFGRTDRGDSGHRLMSLICDHVSNSDVIGAEEARSHDVMIEVKDVSRESKCCSKTIS